MEDVAVTRVGKYSANTFNKLLKTYCGLTEEYKLFDGTDTLGVCTQLQAVVLTGYSGKRLEPDTEESHQGVWAWGRGPAPVGDMLRTRAQVKISSSRGLGG